LQQSSCGFTSDEQKGRITILCPPATVFLMQPRMLLVVFASRTDYWLIVSLLPTKTCRPAGLFCQAVFQLVDPQATIVHGANPPQVQNFALC